MTPEKTLYFANPGASENFSQSVCFHWADFNNEEVHDWKRIGANLLSIPMAHQMVGYYTIADDKDETLKVLRSYQYFATTKIWERVRETNWDDHFHKGGFIWHTTGSGKTMTSFKSAQLIANANDADKVVFLLDRIELSTQSADEYRGFATETGAGTIDAEYINSKFIKFVKNLYTSGPGSEHVKAAEAELHNAFASLSQRDQRTAQRILHDIESGDLRLSPGKTIYDYIKDYQKRECDQQVYTLAEATGLNLNMLKDLVSSDVTAQNLNDLGRFDALVQTVDKVKAVDFLKKVTGQDTPRRFVIPNISSILRHFILDPSDRAMIIFAYQNAEALLDELPEEL